MDHLGDRKNGISGHTHKGDDIEKDNEKCVISTVCGFYIPAPYTAAASKYIKCLITTVGAIPQNDYTCPIYSQPTPFKKKTYLLYFLSK